jgi:hypothetical protein
LSPPSRIWSPTATRLIFGAALQRPERNSHRLKSDVPPPISTTRTWYSPSVSWGSLLSRSAAISCCSSQQ